MQLWVVVCGWGESAPRGVPWAEIVLCCERSVLYLGSVCVGACCVSCAPDPCGVPVRAYNGSAAPTCVTVHRSFHALVRRRVGVPRLFRRSLPLITSRAFYHVRVRRAAHPRELPPQIRQPGRIGPADARPTLPRGQHARGVEEALRPPRHVPALLLEERQRQPVLAHGRAAAARALQRGLPGSWR